VIRWSLALTVGIAVAWLAYRRASAAPRASIALLTVLRAAAVTVVVALLIGAPSSPAAPVAPLLAIDASASWLRAMGDETRAVEALRTRIDSIADGPSGVLLVGDSLRDIEMADLQSFTPADGASRAREAVDRAASMGRSLVLVTDGELEDPDALADAPPGSRIHVLSAAARRDAALADLAVPAAASGGDTITATLSVTAGGAGSTDGTVRLFLDGTSLASAPLPALGPYATTRVRLPAIVPRGTRIALLQAVLQVAGDVEPRNDTLSTALQVGDRPTAVFVSTAPDLDVREALAVLRGALSVPTRAYLRIAPDVWRVEGSLAPIAEREVLAQASAAGLLIVHGDSAWATRARGSNGARSRALWTPAPPTSVARAGETSRAAEWFVSSAPVSPVSAALAGLPFDSLPPLTLAGPARGEFSVLGAQLGKRGNVVSAMAGTETRGTRTLVISGSGYAGWSLRGGRSAQAFTALWGALFDWLAAGRGDLRAARPNENILRAGEPVRWRRGGADSVVMVQLSRRGGSPSNGTIPDSLELRFPAAGHETTSASLPAGVYDVEAAGGRTVLVVNATKELVPRAPTVRDGVLSRGSNASDAPRLADAGWPFALALVLLCAEWIVRRASGYR